MVSIYLWAGFLSAYCPSEGELNYAHNPQPKCYKPAFIPLAYVQSAGPLQTKLLCFHPVKGDASLCTLCAIPTASTRWRCCSTRGLGQRARVQSMWRERGLRGGAVRLVGRHLERSSATSGQLGHQQPAPSSTGKRRLSKQLLLESFKRSRCPGQLGGPGTGGRERWKTWRAGCGVLWRQDRSQSCLCDARQNHGSQSQRLKYKPPTPPLPER